MSHDLGPLIERIRLLANEEPNGASERLLERMEHTLTDGYAHALALEGRSMRIEREIELAVSRIKLGEGGDALGGLAETLAATEQELRSLRAHLASLRVHTERVREAAAVPTR